MLIRAYSDYHTHVRDGQRMKDVVPYTAAHCGRFLVEPNLSPRHIINAPQMMVYRELIRREINHPSEVLMTISLVEETTPDMIRLAAEEGCTAVKLYPAGVSSSEVTELASAKGHIIIRPHSEEITTNSHCGISRDVLISLAEIGRLVPYDPVVKRFWDNLKAIEDSDLVMQIHGELPGEEVLDREKAMLPLIKSILYHFKKIRVVLEHITTCDAAKFVREMDRDYPGRIAATITPHHLMYTLTDLLGSKIRPHLFCKPVLKNRVDQKALISAAVSCNKCFFLGSDTAPWPEEQKECAEGCAGIWNSPVLVPAMFEIFEAVGALPRLENFTSTFGDIFYRKPHVDRYLNVEKTSWVVPRNLHGIVPLLAGEELGWSVATI